MNRPSDIRTGRTTMLMMRLSIKFEQWQVSLKKATDEDIELLFSCLASGLLHVILSECGRHDREKIISFVSTTVHNVLRPYK